MSLPPVSVTQLPLALKYRTKIQRTLYFGALFFALYCSPSWSTERPAAPLTQDNGAPIGNNQTSQRSGPGGPTLLQDVHLIQKLQRFDRERIPERVVHARGTGAYGEFKATQDISHITRAAVFKPGTKTPVFVRFSSVINGTHSPETLRDPRGFATKFYTTEGNWDLVGNNFPTFFIRDAMKFPDLVHSFKPDPRTNLADDARRFDFLSHQPESIRTLTLLYSNEGTPATYRHMDGNSVHAFKLVNALGEIRYAKFRWKTLQGIKNLTPKEVMELQAKDHSHMTRDLVDAIDRGNFPKWELSIQVITPEDFSKFNFDPLDSTKIWPDIPEIKIGEMVLNRNPDNVFQETEQVAMAPSNLVPGIEPSEDPLLQGRLFSYADTQMYRVGANALSLPINQPRVPVSNGNQDGAMNSGKTVTNVNYQPSALHDRKETLSAQLSAIQLRERPSFPENNFQQAGDLYRSYSRADRDDLVQTFGGTLAQIPAERSLTKTRMLSFAYKADPEYGTNLTQVAKGDLAKVKAMAATLPDA